MFFCFFKSAIVINRLDKNKLNIIMTIEKYYNNGDIASKSHHIGHVVKEIDNQIVVFGKKKKLDVLSSEIQIMKKWIKRPNKFCIDISK